MKRIGSEACRRHMCRVLVVLSCTLPALGQETQPQTAVAQRTYRASAYIELWGMTIFSRGDVGGGFAEMRSQPADPNGPIDLVFLSGSEPGRAHGLNRMGYIEEKIVKTDAGKSRSIYFGFITASGENNLEDARKALTAPVAGQVKFLAARGEVGNRQARYTLQSLLLPSTTHWTDARQVIATVRETLSGSNNLERTIDENQLGAAEDVHTFLYSVLSAIRSESPGYEDYCMHNGKLFKLHTTKKIDEKTGAKLVTSKLLPAADRAMRLTGLLRNTGTREETAFRLWYDRASLNPLPLRFEFQPKSYLRLAFEAAPPDVPTLVGALR